MDSRKELLGSNIQRRAKIGDRMIAILHNGESGSILFYAIFTLRVFRSYLILMIMCQEQLCRVGFDDYEDDDRMTYY